VLKTSEEFLDRTPTKNWIELLNS